MLRNMMRKTELRGNKDDGKKSDRQKGGRTGFR
jgi:hypothetical protein